jgi:phosphoribosyl 1,2-cyclic phosphodiesterase
MSRVGGNTSCVVIQRDGEAPIICDIGTGLRFYGLDLDADLFNGTILVSHLHWDHVQGLPFFPQLLRPGSKATVYGPPEADQSFGEAFSGLVRPPYFPVTLDTFGGDVDFVDVHDTTFSVGSATVTARPVPHAGRTNGYRIEWPDFTVAYIPDHQEPVDGTSVADSVLDLAADADLLIHDAQFTPELLAARVDWGHCTTRYACTVAEKSGAKQIALFHHDPLHDDDMVDALEAEAQQWDLGVKVFAAHERMVLNY